MTSHIFSPILFCVYLLMFCDVTYIFTYIFSVSLLMFCDAFFAIVYPIFTIFSPFLPYFTLYFTLFSVFFTYMLPFLLYFTHFYCILPIFSLYFTPFFTMPLPYFFPSKSVFFTLEKRVSRVAQWKRAGPITLRSVDRNHSLLRFFTVSFPLKTAQKRQ